MSGVRIVIEYSVSRTAAKFPWHLLPVKRGRYRESQRRTMTVEVDTAGYRAAFIEHWRNLADYQYLADIAEAAGRGA
jgi:hypothetical protein